ncbi:MAG: hypothetical protein K9G48_08630 [Reyranella sp.]|nr:hypothetical protein [Reyranella sp.]
MLTYPTVLGSLPLGAVPPYVAPATPTPEKAMWLSSRWVDAATLTASSEQGTLVVSNLQDRRPEKKYRATGTSAYVTIDFGEPVICDHAALIGHNLGGSGNIRARGATTADVVEASPVVDTGHVSAWPVSGKHGTRDWPEELSLLRWENDAPLRYWRFDMADPGNTDGYVEAGRLMMGAALQPRINVSPNVGMGLVSPDERVRSPYGRTYTDDRGHPSRRLILSLAAINQSDMREGLFELQRYCGLARDFVFSLDPAATSFFHLYSLQATFEFDAQFESQPLWDAEAQVWRSTINIIEML